MVNMESLFQGIVWYTSFPSTTGRGAKLEVDGGSWATYRATKMRISTTLRFTSKPYSELFSCH